MTAIQYLNLGFAVGWLILTVLQALKDRYDKATFYLIMMLFNGFAAFYNG
jgi:hypothetical protein